MRADLGAAGEHGELRCGGEDRGQIHEVPVAEAPFGLGADEEHAAVPLQEALVDQVAHDRARRSGRRGRARSTIPARAGRRPGVPAGRARAAAGRRCAGVPVGRLPARPSPCPTAEAGLLRWSRPSSSVARNRQLRVVPGRRPVRPRRCRNEATVLGASIWMTRSRSPTSMPSSRVQVETMTQSRASAKACSARRRSSTDSEACERNVVTPLGPQALAELLDLPPGVAEHQPLLARGAGRRSPSPRSPGSRRSRARSRRAGGALRLSSRRSGRRREPARLSRARALQPGEQLFGIADRRGQPDPLHGRPIESVSRSSTASRCQPRSSPAKACTSSTTTARRPAKKAAMVDVGADQHRLERLRRGQQDVGPLAQDPPAVAAVRRRRARARRGPAEPGGVRLQPGREVVQQRLERADVEHRGPGPALRGHPGQQREGAASVLPPAVGASSTASSPSSSGSIASSCSGRRPGQPRVLTMWCSDAGVQPVQRFGCTCHGRSSSMSSALSAAALRSTSVSSSLPTVSA